MPARLFLAGCAIALAGCDLAPAYTPPAVTVPTAFKEEVAAKPGRQPKTGPWQPAQPSDASPRGPWWEAYRDPELDRLEAQVDVANQTLAATVAVYDQARAFAQEAEAGLYPTVGIGGTITTNKQSSRRPLRSPNQPSYYGANTIGGQANYELDVWGRVRDFVAAGKAAAQASDADLEELRLSLHAELANDYVTLRGLDEQIRLLQDTVNAYGGRWRWCGTGSAATLPRGSTSPKRKPSSKCEDADLRRDVATATAGTCDRHADWPAGAGCSRLAESAVPISQPDVPPGLPSTLLQRRPDVAAAERQVASANQLVGVAEAAFYPSFSLRRDRRTAKHRIEPAQPAIWLSGRSAPRSRCRCSRAACGEPNWPAPRRPSRRRRRNIAPRC